MGYITSILFAFAVSADGFVAGMAYGVKKIRIPVFSLLVISLASALAVTISMLCGKGLATALALDTASKAGALIIMGIGVYFLLKALGERINSIIEEDEPIISLTVKSLGIVVQILKDPAKADFDASGEINSREAFFLGLALAMDAMGAGIGIAMAGLNIFVTALAVGVLKFIMISAGTMLGKEARQGVLQNFAIFVPGLLFIGIGVSEFL